MSVQKQLQCHTFNLDCAAVDAKLGECSLNSLRSATASMFPITTENKKRQRSRDSKSLTAAGTATILSYSQ